MERKDQARAKAEARRRARKLKKHGLASLGTEDIAVIFQQLGLDSMVEAVQVNDVGGSDISNCADHHDFARLFAAPLALETTRDPFQELMNYVASTISAGKT